MADKLMSKLLKKGSPILNQKCTTKITKFPIESEVEDAIDLCAEELRRLSGFWKGKGMSVAAT